MRAIFCNSLDHPVLKTSTTSCQWVHVQDLDYSHYWVSGVRAQQCGLQLSCKEFPVKTRIGRQDEGHTSAEYAARHNTEGGFCPSGPPADPSEVGVHFFDSFVSFEFSRDPLSCERLECRHTLSFGVLSRVARADPVEDPFTRVTASEAPPRMRRNLANIFVKERPARDCPSVVQVGKDTIKRQHLCIHAQRSHT